MTPADSLHLRFTRTRNPLFIVFPLWLGLVFGCVAPGNPAPTVPKQLTAEHRSAIQKQLKSSGYPMPDSLEINDTGYLVATYELRGPVSDLSLRMFAEDNIMAIREAMLPFKVVSQYRVTLNGAPPGTGLIRRYGSARFIEGGTVEWKSGI